MQKIKVAFFAEILTENLDGAVRTMYQLINRIDRRRFEFLFIYGEGPDRIAGFETFRVPSVVLPVNRGYSLAMPFMVQNKLRDELQKFDPDVVHIATPSLLGEFALRYANESYLPVITIYHTHFISYIDYYFKHLPFLINGIKHHVKDKYCAFYNRCNKVYVPSESLANELTKTGIDAARMQLWKRGIDTQLFSPRKKDIDKLAAVTGNTNPTVLFASRLVWEKNLETLINVYNQLQKTDPDVNFLVAGDGVALKACKQRMPKAVFTGKISHELLSVLYASADVFLFPSVSETYGNVVLEAMASGLPCVIADGGGSRDFIQQGINGFKCAPFDAADYAEKIKCLLSGERLRKQFVQQGLNYSSKFSWDALAATYFDDLKQMTRRKLLTAV